MVYKFFDKKSTGSGIASSSILADDFHKPVIKKFNKGKVYLQFKDNIWGVDLADMQSLGGGYHLIVFFLVLLYLFPHVLSSFI